jgi:Icc-related predicted phosphoesterase
MRILHVADLHFRKSWFSWVAEQASHYDAVVIAGDLLDLFARHETPLGVQAEWVAGWIRACPGKLLITSGNHDYEYREAGWLKRDLRPGVFVDGQTTQIRGYKVSLLGWAPGPTPRETDILIVHAPPSGLTISLDAKGRDGGWSSTREVIERLQPKLVLSGHVHDADAWWGKLGPSLCLNAGCNLTAALPRFIEISLAAGYAELHLPADEPTPPSISAGRVNFTVSGSS